MSAASFSAQMNCKERGGDTLLPICILVQSGVLPLANNELLDGLVPGPGIEPGSEDSESVES